MSLPFRIRVPATTANLGPGFDALGLALGLYNTVDVHASDALRIDVSGEGAATLPRDASNLIVASAARACERIGRTLPTLHLHCTHAIPTARGLGSSASAVVAGLMIAWAAHGLPLDREAMLALATEIEGHPDNAAPAIFGGLECAVHHEAGVAHVRVPVTSFPHVVLFVPDFEMSTRTARSVLPDAIPRDRAVFNIARSTLLVSALTSGRTDLLGVATEDALHQRPREAMFPAMPKVIAAARDAGAFGAWLSGAGSTVAAFVSAQRTDRVVAAWTQCSRDHRLGARIVVSPVDLEGAVVEPLK